MSIPFAQLRRFRFNAPQRVAAILLALLLAQIAWLFAHTAQGSDYARCGQELWTRHVVTATAYTSCGEISDGILAYRVAGLPAALTGSLLLAELPFVAAALMLGAALWWVSRRLYGNLGGYVALGFYCFSPEVVRAAVTPNADILAALGVYGGLYTAIGVAHAMQGPRRKWRPRIVLLTAAFGLAAAAHIIALPLLVLGGLAFMLWIAEDYRRGLIPMVMLRVLLGALLIVFACYALSPHIDAVLNPNVWHIGISLAAWHWLMASTNQGLALALLFTLLIYAGMRKARYFGNTVPLLCAVVLLLISAPHTNTTLWAVPFLCTFLGGVFADVLEGPRRQHMLLLAAILLAMQAILCVHVLHGQS